MTDKHYTLIDVCWTLFYSNTTFDFLDFAMKDNEEYVRLRRIGKSWLGRTINLIAYKLTNVDRERIRCVQYLKGKSQTELQALAEQFYQEYLLPRRIEPVWQMLSDKHLVIVSGTLDIIAQTVGRHLGAEACHASEMIYSDDRFTGRFNDRLLDKTAILPFYTDYDIITDNLTDIHLVRNARKATIITYNNKHRWQNILPAGTKCTFIDAEQSRY